jgi:hypothetical protein
MSAIPNVAVGAARAYAEKLFGGPLTENETNPSIGTTVATVIEGSGDRVGLVIVNQGNNPLFIGTQSNVSSTNGILLAANGGNVSMDVTRDFTLPSRKWFGITTGGSTNVWVLEVLRVSFGTPGL